MAVFGQPGPPWGEGWSSWGEQWEAKAADVFAWLMHIENIRQTKANVPKDRIGQDLDSGFATNYPDVCVDCEAKPCRCPRILKRTVGRIAKEMPRDMVQHDIFMPAQERRAMFRL